MSQEDVIQAFGRLFAGSLSAAMGTVPSPPPECEQRHGDLCGCYQCAVSALTKEDREWLVDHGWIPPDSPLITRPEAFSVSPVVGYIHPIE